MALQIVEFFGYEPLDPAAQPHVTAVTCPFINQNCIKPNHGACSVRQTTGDPIICCPNRMYGQNYQILLDVAVASFGPGVQLAHPNAISLGRLGGTLTGNEVAVFGRYWGAELPLPRPPGASGKSRQYYVDWILAKVDANGDLSELTAVEVQTIDTTGSYAAQAQAFFQGQPFTDPSGRTPGWSNAGMNWENVNKRILPQIIYKGHVLRREVRCTKGLFFVCPRQVYDQIFARLGGNLNAYHPSSGTLTFRSYELGPPVPAGQQRAMNLYGQFTTTVDQVALAFTSPMNLPAANVYEAAINKALGI